MDIDNENKNKITVGFSDIGVWLRFSNLYLVDIMA